MAKTCVLVVDDEPIGREMMAENLTYEGYLVVEADSGEAAWDLIDAEPARFHVILLDRLMPDMDGIALLEKMREAHPGLPVIMMTAFGSVDTAKQALKLGAHDYLLKPIDVDELLVTLRKVLQTRQLKQENLTLRKQLKTCLLYTSPSPRDRTRSRMPSSA